MRGHTDNRGQLILAGAVVFSLVLIGIVVVFSTTLFTANMASSSANAGVSDSGALESDVEQTVEELVERIDNEDEFKNEIEDEGYSQLLSERYAGSGPTIVSVSVDEAGDVNNNEAQVTVVYETRSVTTERTIEVGND